MPYTSMVFNKGQILTHQHMNNIIEGIDEVHDGIPIAQILNDNKIFYNKNFNKVNFPSSMEVIDKTDSTVTCKCNSTGTIWMYLSTNFVPTGSNLVHIEIDWACLAGTPSVSVWVSDGRINYAEGYCERIYLDESGKIHATFDPSYYAVYKDPAWNEFNVWVTIAGLGTTVQFRDYKIYEDAGSFVSISGDNAEELFQSVDEKITNLENINAKNTASIGIVYSPNMVKYQLAASNEGQIFSIPVIPRTISYIGNSLLAGNGYGMAASAENKDYYYLVNDYIESIIGENGLVAQRISGSSFEGVESLDNVEAEIVKITSSLFGDEDCVIIQLGDNVNTVLKNEVFKTSCSMLVQAIRNKCPKARVFWVGMWYGSDNKYGIIEQACKTTGAYFISLKDIAGKSENNSFIGAIQIRPKNTYTCDNVSNIIENSPISSAYNITVTFILNSISYNATINCDSYSLNDGKLTYIGNEYIINNAGVASHPGDEGFRKIANTILYNTDMCDIKEYYDK